MDAGVPFAWFTPDEVYGQASRGIDLAVPSVGAGTHSPAGRVGRGERDEKVHARNRWRYAS
ncbi:hypothetical protein [Actinosynnema sp. ALI-1.44]|uniref:hypothetical protein n=1 Tax=Actinosynnema sp. ALI-1.44 TaxID=1933779 RepID=UPI00117851C1|nr:hypothetical protein [Actinosynnema sp. ALI-1.44]